jgi:hypothetical protein
MALVTVDPQRREVYLANGERKTIPAIFSGIKDEDTLYESVKRFLQGNRWTNESDEIAVLV